MKTILFFLFTVLVLPAVQSQNFSGQYSGTFNGDAVRLSLASAGPGQWTGTMNDSQQEYKVNLDNIGSDCSGSAICESLGITFELAGKLNGQTLELVLKFMGAEMPVVLTKAGGQTSPTDKTAQASPSTAMPKLPANAQHDPKLVGTWVRQENYNSGAGMDGYYSNNSYLAFHADGTLTDLGGETMVGSNAGAGRSSSSGKGVVPGVKWYTEKSGIFLVATDGAKTETVRLGKYFIENGAMLITADNGTKQLFYKK